MMRLTICKLLVLFSVAELAVTVKPLGGTRPMMALVKRQDLCVSPVICEQSASSCTSCEAGFYCTFDGGCCEEGQICSGYKPCVNAGTPVQDAEETQVCPTDAPICTASDLVPVCSGGINDWRTISEALNRGAQTTDIDTSAFTTPSVIIPPVTSIPELDSTSTPGFEFESTATVEETSVVEIATSRSTTAADVTESSASSTRSAPSTTTSTQTVPNSGAQLGLRYGVVAAVAILAALLL